MGITIAPEFMAEQHQNLLEILVFGTGDSVVFQMQ